jgi:predicted ATPase/Flp pilus assembly protein TadD
MAPEQIRNARTVDGKADVFALGCVLFEALTGRPAFEGVDPVIVLARILFEPLPIPSAVRAALSEELDALVSAMLSRELERRPAADALTVLVQSAAKSVASSAVARLAAAPIDAARGGAQLDLTSVESSRERPMPFSRRLVHRALATRENLGSPFVGTFVGREEEYRHVTALLRAGTRLVTVWGGPGIGKTRLIREVVRACARDSDSPWDAVVMGDLADARDADDVARILAREAGVALEPSAAPEVALANALGKLGRVLMVVDPVDHLVTPLTAMLVAFERSAPGVQIVAASRTRWRPPGAVAIEVGPLACGRDGGHASAAARLFLDRVERHAPSHRSANADHESVDERVEQLVHALDGIPLAIELYAARIEFMPMVALLASVPGQAGSDVTIDGGEGPMARAIAWSWQLLTPAEQGAFAQCAVFRGGFTLEAAEKVVDPGAGASTRDLIQSLRDKSLLCSSVLDRAAARLTMFAPVRDFAWRMLKSGPDIGQVLERHALYYAGAFAPDPSTALAEFIARIEGDAENLFAAAEFSLSDDGADPAVGMRVLLALEPAMVARGAMGGYRGLLERAMKVTSGPAASPRVEDLVARVRQLRARLDAPRGLADRAKEDLAICLRAAERAGDTHWRGGIELDLGVVHHLERDLDQARRSYETALALLATDDDPRSMGRCIGNLGALCHDEGDFPAAARWYRRAIELFERAADARQRANCIGNLALLEQDLGHREAARELFDRALTLLESVGDARLLAITLGNSGVLEVELGRPEMAIERYERSLALLEGSGDRRSEALGWGRLGAALALLGRTEEAETKIIHGERLAPAGDVLLAEAVRLSRAFLDLSRGDEGKARVRARLDRVCAPNEAPPSPASTSRDEGAARRDPSRLPARSLCDQSDDIRSTVRILEAELTAR